MKSLLAGVVLVIGACGPAARTAPRGGLVAWKERVVAREAWTSITDAPWIFRHVARDAGMASLYVLLSSSGRFCPVDLRTWNEAHDGALFECVWQWPS